MSGEEDVIKKRLLVEGDGGGDDKRIMSLLKTYIRWCTSSLTEEDSEATYQKMLFTIAQCEFSFSKAEIVMEMNRLEMERYEILYKEIERNIQEAMARIAEYREELQRSRVIRKHRQEYDALAKVIQQHPQRASSEEKIAKLEEHLQKLTSSQKDLHLKLELRRKQLYLLVHSIHQLQKLLTEEDSVEPVSMDS